MNARNLFRRRSPWAILLLCPFCFAGCAAPAKPPASKPGTHMELQTVTHDWQTTYLYRPVPN